MYIWENKLIMAKEKVKVTTISIPEKVRERGHKSAQKMFGKEKCFSSYLQVLINADCDLKKIK